MEGHIQHHHHHHHQLQQQVQQQQKQYMSGMVGVDAGDSRFPQWSIQETKEFLGIRSELDRTFMETKRNKILWEVISTRMREKGFNRSAEQCKCKWKNLVTRYKGCETIESEATRHQFPFYNEMQSIFTARMQRMLWAEAGGGTTTSRKKQPLSSDEEAEAEEDSEGETTKAGGRNKNKPNKKAKVVIGGGGGVISSVKEMVEELMKQQVQMEEEWRESYEAREEERRRVEAEWRQRMVTLEEERVAMERRWREREEQRRLREEARAEKRDALITALLNKLTRHDANVETTTTIIYEN